MNAKGIHTIVLLEFISMNAKDMVQQDMLCFGAGLCCFFHEGVHSGVFHTASNHTINSRYFFYMLTIHAVFQRQWSGYILFQMMQLQPCPPCCSQACLNEAKRHRHSVEYRAALPSTGWAANRPPVRKLITVYNEQFSWGIITMFHFKENYWFIKVWIQHCVIMMRSLWV